MDNKNNNKQGFARKHPILINLVAICITFIVICIIAMIGLSIFTEHGKYKNVPDVRRLPVRDAVMRIENAGFKCEITDSTYNDSYPLGSVIEQDPKANAQAKSVRTVYLSVNASSPRLVALPGLNDQSVRQCESTLLGLGFKNISINRIQSPYKDLILDVQADGKRVTSGSKLPLSARITLIVGDGNEVILSPDSIDNSAMSDNADDFEF